MPTPAHAAAAALDALRAPLPRALVGFDGFIDVISSVVSRRSGMDVEDFAPFSGIAEFSQRIAGAAGRSANIELIVREERFGGNGPLLAGGLAALGAPTTFVGCISNGAAGVHPVFAPFAARCERVVPIARPSRTECLEFQDGKVMFNKVFDGSPHGDGMQQVRWSDVVRAMGGLESVRAIVASCSLIGIVNWSIMAGVEDIWSGLARDVLPFAPPPPSGGGAAALGGGGGSPRRILIDISDPAKRSTADIDRAMRALGNLHRACPVTLGLNLSEAEQLCSAAAGPDRVREWASLPLPARCTSLAESILIAANVECVVVHPRQGAAGARVSAYHGTESIWIDGPFTPNPVLSTGAGDHFNAGLGVGLTLGLPLAQCLAIGVATSGAYVRDGASPSRARVCELLRGGATS